MAGQSRSVLPYTCHQVIHTWHKDCIPAALILAKSSYRESFKIYCLFYGVSEYFIEKILFIYSDYCFFKTKKNQIN
jgi:hypothetical protein